MSHLPVREAQIEIAMKKVEIKELSENFFEAIGKEWMLVTAGNKDGFNTMTASWGGIGWLWNKPVAFVFVRPERYTYEFGRERRLSHPLFFWEKKIKRFMPFADQSPVEVDKEKNRIEAVVYRARKCVF